MTSATSYGSYVEALRERGLKLDPGNGEKVYIDGRSYERRIFADRRLGNEAGIPERIVRGTAGVALGISNLSSSCLERSWGVITKGRIEENVLVPNHETDRSRANLIQNLGYDPTKNESIQEYLKIPRIWAQLEGRDGHFMLREERRGRTSSFIFVPNGDFSKATSIVLSTSKTGEALKGAQLQRAMYTFSAQYEDLKEGMEKGAEKFATDYLVKNPTANKNKIKQQYLEQMQGFVISARRKHTRVFGHVDTNKRGLYDWYLGGYKIDWSEGTKKDVKDLHEMEPGKELKASYPFAEPAPPPTDRARQEPNSGRS